MSRTLIVILALIAAATGGLAYQGWQQFRPPRVDFNIPDLTGQPRRASEFDGQVVLLNFWAPWCAPCREEIPMLNELQRQYGEQGLQILGPVVDQPDAVRAFMEVVGLNYPVLSDLPAVLRLQDAYGEQRLPFSVLINRRGRVVYRHAGELQRDAIQPRIEQQL